MSLGYGWPESGEPTVDGYVPLQAVIPHEHSIVSCPAAVLCICRHTASWNSSGKLLKCVCSVQSVEKTNCVQL
jgi:hypothetical protein